MIERYSLSQAQHSIEKRFKAQCEDSFDLRYNAAPTQVLPIITLANPNRIKLFNWGTEPSSNNKKIASKLINAPLAQLTEKIFYKNALKSRRCLVIADGFYVWKSISKKGQIPYRITMADEELFTMAGIYETYENLEGFKIGTFSIITHPAPPSIANLTQDAPIIIPIEFEEQWLQNTGSLEQNLELLTSITLPELKSYVVSPLVNNLANDRKNLLNPAPPADQFGNYSLFD